MKKVFFITAVMLLGISTGSFAQFQVGGGLSLGTEVSIDDDGSEKMGFGINIKGKYAFNEQWSFSPDFIYFFPSTPEGYDLTLWQLNANAHYNFHQADNIGIYGIGGLNYSYWKSEMDLGDAGDFFGIDGTADDSEIGLNLGAGASMDLFYGEVKYDTAFEQITLSVGVLF